MGFRAATTAVAAMAMVASTPGLAHEMFLKAQESMVPSNSDQVVRLINGTFEKSENSISRDRMADVRIVANGSIANPPNADWYDDDDSSYLKYRAGDTGTYVIGVSTRPNIITMSPEDFITVPVSSGSHGHGGKHAGPSARNVSEGPRIDGVFQF